MQWLAAQVLADGSLASENTSIATQLQSRSEADRTLRLQATASPTLTSLIGTQTEDNTEYLARQAITLSIAGQDASVPINALLQHQNIDGGFGGDSGADSNALDTAWALQAFNAARQTAPVPAAVGYLQTVQQADGSFVVGNQEIPYASAYVLSALHPHVTTYAIAGNVQSLVNYLLAQQSAPGVWGNSPFLTAVVYTALHDFIPLDPTGSQVQAYLQTIQLADGSWGGDPYVTALVVRSLLLTSVQPNNPTKASIAGKVVDGQTGLPLAGVTVSLGGAGNAAVNTGTDGVFSFRDLAAGNYSLSVTLANYGTLSTNTALTAGQTLDFGTMQLTKAAGATTGTVKGLTTDLSTGKPLVGATITVNGGAYTTTTDVMGSYQIANVAPGALALTANASGYYPIGDSGSLTAAGVLQFSPTFTPVTLPPPNPSAKTTVMGVVLDAGSNQGLAGVAVSVNDAAGLRNFVTGSDGRFTVADVAQSGNVKPSLGFSLAGYQSSVTGLLLSGSPTLDLGQVRLRKAGVQQLLPDLAVTKVSRTTAVTDAQSLNLSGAVQVSITNLGTADVPAGIKFVAFFDGNRNGGYDANVDTLLGSYVSGQPLAVGATQTLQIAVQGKLPFRDAPITVLADSDGALVESNKANNINSTAAAAEIKPNIGSFKPVIKFNALSGYTVISTPLVIDLKIPNQTTPSIVVPVWLSDQWGGARIAAVSGKDGQTLFFTDSRYPVAAITELAVGDIDGDGFPEIIGAAADNRHIYAFDHLGNLKWVSDTVQLPARSDYGGAISIADLDNDGIPEIVIGTLVFSNTGKLIADGRSLGGSSGTNSYANISVVADIDLDGRPEIIAGPSAYRLENGTLKLVWKQPAVGDGLVGIANFNKDPYPEIVVVSSGTVYLLDHLGNIIWGPVALPGGGIGGAPTIADFDGDGVPEIGVTGFSKYVVINSDGSIRWQSDSQDYSSSTGSTSFDFTGDGSASILYRDQQYLRVFNGSTGAIIWQIPMSSSTATEYPVVADVDGNGHADIVVSADHYWVGGTNSGIYVISDANNSWLNTRKIWNQHSYHITNINDDGSIPKNEQNSWQVTNNYRLNARPGVSATAVPDLTASYIRINDQGGQTASTLAVRVGNGGGQGVAAGVSIAYYNGQPGSGGVLLGAAKTTTVLASGDYEDVTLNYNGSLSAIATLYVVVDDDGTGKGAITDFDRSNNTVSMTLSALPGSFGLSVSTDKLSYGANSAVQIAALVANHGSFDGTVLVRFVIQTAQGQVVATLPTQSLSLPHNGQQAANALWNTATTIAGAYQVKSELVDTNGVPYAEAMTAFSIDGGQNALTSAVTTDKQSYAPSDSVRLTSRVTNTSINQQAQALTVITTLNDPGGALFASRTESLPSLVPGELKDYIYTLPLNFAPAGQYSASLAVIAATGATLAQSSATFAVGSTAGTGSGLQGALAVSPKQVPQGNSVVISYTAKNQGNSALANLPLKVSIIDPVAQKIMAEFPTTQNIDQGLSYSAAFNWLATGAVGSNYVAVLSAVVGSKTLTLAQDTFTLIAPPIKLDISQTIPAGNRILVLLGCKSTDYGGGSVGNNDANYCGDNENNNAGQPNDASRQPQSQCMTQRSQTLSNALNGLGVPYLITQRESEFKQTMRGGLYNTYWIAGMECKFHDDLAAEIREAIFAGNGLILDGAHDERNHILDSATGITYRGKFGETDLTAELTGPLYPAQRLPTVGRALKLSPNGSEGVQQATLYGKNGAPLGIGIFTRSYGAGRAVTHAFDLVDSLQAEPRWQGVLATGLQYVMPKNGAASSGILTPGAYLPIQTSIVNQGQSVDIDVKSIFPTGAIYLGANFTGSYSASANTLDWNFNLPARQSTALTLALQVPPTAGDYTLQTLVNTVSNGTSTLYGTALSQPIKVAAADQTGADAARQLQAFNLANKKNQQLRDALVSELKEALTHFNKNTLDGYEKAIAALIDIVDKLGGLTGVDTSAVHADLDRILQEAQWRWTLLPQPSPTTKKTDRSS